MSVGDDARRYLRAHTLGVLSTHSASVSGYPFGSVVPFVTDHAARPVILISALAEHTRSLLRDPRASLVVHDFSVADAAGPRLTLVGDASPCPDAAGGARYVRFFPEATRLLELGGFSFWQLEPVKALFIRGFGNIDWLPGEALSPPSHALGEAEAEIVAHMNEHHASALADYCRYVHDMHTSTPRMIGIDCDGFDVRAGERVLRFAFESVVCNAADARQALVKLAQQARRN
jgi:putative heme iron utilization protein